MDIDMKAMAEGNREAWNEALTYHQKARKGYLLDGFSAPGFTTFDRDCDSILTAKLNEIGMAGKTISQLPCNNGRELLSLMRLGAKEAVGFDISDMAIEEARTLTRISGLNARFERIDILETGDEYNSVFDFIYISEGSLQWFPDLNEYFDVVSRLLKRDGRVLVFEIHPFAYLLEEGFHLPEVGFQSEDLDSDNVMSYFEKGPHSYKDGLDYIGGESMPQRPVTGLCTSCRTYSMHC